MISRYRHARLEVLTTRLAGGEAVLPVFGAEDEAGLFLRCRAEGREGGWRVRETGAGELVSVLFGPCGETSPQCLRPIARPAVSGGRRNG